jgi:hypothetical protein
MPLLLASNALHSAALSDVRQLQPGHKVSHGRGRGIRRAPSPAWVRLRAASQRAAGAVLEKRHTLTFLRPELSATRHRVERHAQQRSFACGQ